MLQGSKASVAKGQLVTMTKKYGTTGFMYTEYPHKRFWNQEFSDREFQEALTERFGRGQAVPTMLYVHIPFCPQLCWFCTCHMVITQDYEKIKGYMEFIYREIAWLREFFKKNSFKPDFREIHLGGGSPTVLNEADFSRLVGELNSLAEISKLDEFALEIDPRRVDRARMEFYASKGINRISFGVQDFDLQVQKAVNRVQPAELIRNLITPDIRSRFKNGVNFDIICGLPNQTPETMSRTCEAVAGLAPDRICLNYLHYSPEMAQHQRMMVDGKEGRPDRLPDYGERKEIFLEALKIFDHHGYVRTGYDHFAKPTDANARAMDEGSMGWNELGVTPGRVFDVIGIGVSSLSTVGDYYFQNFYEMIDYEGALTQGRFPIYRGYKLNHDDIIRREIIQTLRIFFKVDLRALEKKYGIKFTEYFKKEAAGLQEFVRDGLVELSDAKIEITELGRQFANIVCRTFDVFYDGNKLLPDLGERAVEENTFQHAWSRLMRVFKGNSN